MRQRLVWLALGAFALGCGSAEDGSTSGGEDVPVEPATKPVTGLGISEVAVYQAVKVPIMAGGTVVEQASAPIVAGRQALFRVFVVPQPEWQPREVIARLELATADGQVFPVQEIRRLVQGPSYEDDLGSTFSFDVPAEQMLPNVGYSVGLYEADPAVDAPGHAGGAIWPPDTDKLFVGAQAVGPLRLTLVPVQYYGDSSGRLPDLSESQIAAYRDAFMRLFPVPDVQVSVREPVAFSQNIEPFGGGWQQLLQTILVRRSSDGVPDDVYYYGLFQPTDSIFQFCGQGCVAGLSLLPGATDTFMRGSIGLGYGGGLGGDNSTNTMVHEIGHAHGREHAPCGLGGQRSDPLYPHPNASLGTWGFDILSKELYSPDSRSDLMSYCQPYWISDYSYSKLFERSVFVNSFAQVQRAPGVPETYRMLSVDMKGQLDWSSSMTLRHTPTGEPREIDLVDAGGKTTGTVTGHFYPYDHLPGGIVLLPEPELRGHAVRYEGKIKAL